MPPRYAYWTIIAGGLPTAFRAADRDELMPTFQRIKEKHPDAEMKWFARGKLWESQDAARAADTARNTRGRGPRDAADREGERRTRDWRPGGDHRDPRQKFIDGKKQRNATIRKERWNRKQAAGVRSQGSDVRRDDSNRERPDDRISPPRGPAEGEKPRRRPFQARGSFRKGPRR